MSSNARKPEPETPNAQIGGDQHDVLIFRPYSLQPGDKIHIDGGPRQGDWEVIEVKKHKIKLRCPVSLREIESDHFFSFIERRAGVLWPGHD